VYCLVRADTVIGISSLSQFHFVNFHFCTIYYLYNYVVFLDSVANKKLNILCEECGRRPQPKIVTTGLQLKKKVVKFVLKFEGFG